MIVEYETKSCLGCGQTTWFAMTEEQLRFLLQGVHVQTIFPEWSPEDRELLISGTCPSCWEEMWAEEEGEDAWEDKEAFYTTMELLDPESDSPEYERDWYVD